MFLNNRALPPDSLSDRTMRVRVLLPPCYLHEGGMTVFLEFFR